MYGGGQQKGIRSGTENVPGIAGMALAAKILYEKLDADVAKLYELKKHFIEKASEIEGVQINGLTEGGLESITETAPHIISVSVKDVRNQR